MSSIEWHKLVEIDRSWVDRHLKKQFSKTNAKISVTGYSILASGTTISPQALAEELVLMLPEYVFSKEDVKRHGQRKAMQLSQKFFGQRNTQTEGKYGELLLFALAESVLDCKMVAHKIRSLTNNSDQVKGGDGVFLGNYTIPTGKTLPAYLIGESKITAQRSTAFDEAFNSLNRFHNIQSSPEFQYTELIVAKENLSGFDDVDPDTLYEMLTPSTERFKSQILVHPILIMFNSAKLSSLEVAALSSNDLEQSIKEHLSNKADEYIEIISKKLVAFPSIQRVYLEFFVIPFNNIDHFRNTMYYQIHGVPYEE